jgi:hypothetical protein
VPQPGWQVKIGAFEYAPFFSFLFSTHRREKDVRKRRGQVSQSSSRIWKSANADREDGNEKQKEKLRSQKEKKRKKDPVEPQPLKRADFCMTGVNTPFSRNSKRRATLVVSSNHFLPQTVSSPIKGDFPKIMKNKKRLDLSNMEHYDIVDFALKIHLSFCLGFWKRNNVRGGGSESRKVEREIQFHYGVIFIIFFWDF